MIFTTKSLIYTCITGAIGLIFYYIIGTILGLKAVGIGITIFFAVIGFIVGTCKIPDSNGFELGRKVGGEEIDKAFLRWLKFKRKKNVIYTYLGSDEKNLKN